MKNINKTTLFLVLTFGISYTLAGLFYLSGLQYPSTAGNIMAVFYMFVPAISVLLVEKVIHHEKIRYPLLISFKINKWFLVAWLLPLVLTFLTIGISLLFPGVTYSSGPEGLTTRFEDAVAPEKLAEMKQNLETMVIPPVIMILLSGLFAGITINAVAAFGEELGWRGFLVRQFKEMSFWQAALVTGFIWGVWHAPLILMGHNYPQHPVMGVFLMTAWCMLLGPIFLYITIKAKSVIAASVTHGTINAVAGLAILTVIGGNDLLTGMTGLAGFIAVGLVVVLIFIYDRYISREKIMAERLVTFLPAFPEQD